MMDIGTFDVDCPICGIQIPVRLVMSPAPITREEPKSISLSASADVSLFELHMETHEGNEAFDD